MPHQFEKRPPTIKQYTAMFELWSEQTRKNAERIKDSSECRKFLIKNSDSAPLQDLILAAVRCIYDLTGDEQFLKQVTKSIERRSDETTE